MTDNVKPLKGALKSVKGEDDTVTKALLLGVNQLRDQIINGEVIGVAFAVEYKDGGHGSHYVATSEDPRNLYFALCELKSRVFRESTDE